MPRTAWMSLHDWDLIGDRLLSESDLVAFGNRSGRHPSVPNRFRGRNVLLLSIIVTMMIPTQLGILPLWGMMQTLRWYDTLYAVTVPCLVTAFGVFMMRQYASQAVSDELIEAGRIEGAGTLRIYWNIVLPALRPAAGVLGLLTFMETWDSFLWPYAVLTPENPMLQVSLSFL